MFVLEILDEVEVMIRMHSPGGVMGIIYYNDRNDRNL